MHGNRLLPTVIVIGKQTSAHKPSHGREHLSAQFAIMQIARLKSCREIKLSAGTRTRTRVAAICQLRFVAFAALFSNRTYSPDIDSNKMATNRAPFPSNPDDFDSDTRISFSKAADNYILEDENSEEWEWHSRTSKWVPMVCNSR